MSTLSQKSKKILFVTRPLCEPWDEASKNFAFDLAKNVTDHDITILTGDAIKDAPSHLTQKAIYRGAHFSLIQKLRAIFFLWKHAKEYDVIHLLFTPTKINSWLMQYILPQSNKIIQTIATIRDDLYSAKELQKMYFADTLVTYSQYAQQKLQKLFHFEAGLPSDREIRHIYPGIDLKKFIPEGKSATLLQKWNLDKKDIIVTYPGEFVRLGATELILDALIELWASPENHHIKYLCACRIKNDADAVKKNEVIERLRAVGHLDKVIFTDTFGDMNAVYNLSDIVIFPVTSMQGKFDVPLAMIEPYACKKPVIATDLPLFREFSSDAINVIIPKNDESALARAIAKLAQNPLQRQELGEASFSFVHDTFNITRIAQQYTELYGKL